MIIPKTLSPWLVALQETKQFKAYATMKDDYTELLAWGNTLGLCYQLEQECRWVEKHYPGGLRRVLAAIPAHTLTIYNWKLEQEREGQTVFIGAPYSHIVGFDQHMLTMQAMAKEMRTQFSPEEEPAYSPLERLCMGVDWRQSTPDIHIGLKLLQKALELFLFQQIWLSLVNQDEEDWARQIRTFQEEVADLKEVPRTLTPFSYFEDLWKEWNLLTVQEPAFVERTLPAVRNGCLTFHYDGCFYGQVKYGNYEEAKALAAHIDTQLELDCTGVFTPAEWISNFIVYSLSKFSVAKVDAFATSLLTKLLELYRQIYPLPVELQVHPLPAPIVDAEAAQ